MDACSLRGIDVDGMTVAAILHDFITAEALPGTGVEPAAFWAGFAALVRDFAPRNRALLARRDQLQAEVDGWIAPIASSRTIRRPTKPFCARSATSRPNRALHRDHGAGRCRDRRASPDRSLWCRCRNARYALNAANARWGSLYDALYGTDAIPETGRPAPRRLQPCAGRPRHRLRARHAGRRRAAGRRHARATPPATRSRAARWSSR